MPNVHGLVDVTRGTNRTNNRPDYRNVMLGITPDLPPTSYLRWWFPGITRNSFNAWYVGVSGAFVACGIALGSSELRLSRSSLYKLGAYNQTLLVDKWQVQRLILSFVMFPDVESWFCSSFGLLMVGIVEETKTGTMCYAGVLFVSQFICILVAGWWERADLLCGGQFAIYAAFGIASACLGLNRNTIGKEVWPMALINILVCIILGLSYARYVPGGILAAIACTSLGAGGKIIASHFRGDSLPSLAIPSWTQPRGPRLGGQGTGSRLIPPIGYSTQANPITPNTDEALLVDDKEVGPAEMV